jgi:large subunit ribosomal protein L25
MAKDTKIVAQKRDVSGSSSSNRLRKDGWLPGIINTNKGDSRMIQMNRHEFDMFLRHHRSESLLLDVEVEGEKSRKVLLKEVQHHPVTDEILHVDFLEVSMTRKMRVNIPLRFIGDPIGVTQEGGVLDCLLREIEVECLPGDLVEGIDVDVSGLKVGDTVRVSELKVSSKLVVLTNGSVAVAGCSIPKVIEEAPAEAEAAPTEPELIGAKKEGEEGEEAAEGEEAGKEKGEKAEKGDKAEKGEKAPKEKGEKAPKEKEKAAAPEKAPKDKDKKGK